MLPEGERLATLEANVAGLREDVAALSVQMDRSRQRLHNLEGFAQAYLDLQKSNRRAEDRQYRRLGLAVGLGGLAMTFGLLVLAAITLWTHVG